MLMQYDKIVEETVDELALKIENVEQNAPGIYTAYFGEYKGKCFYFTFGDEERAMLSNPTDVHNPAAEGLPDTTVEFNYEIRCSHDPMEIEKAELRLWNLLKGAGFVVESNVAIPVGSKEWQSTQS